MADRRTHNTADAVAHLTNLIMEERRKIADSMAAISEYADQLSRLSEDTERRLLTRD
jgi:hypothetical protein